MSFLDNKGENLQMLGKKFLDLSLKAQSMKEKLDLNKIENFIQNTFLRG